MWKQEKLEAQLDTVRHIKDLVIVSGGLAWHIMSPEHTENKYIHDHKDVDLFSSPSDFPQVVTALKNLGYKRYWTKYDRKTPNFYRYGASVKRGTKRVKVLIDLFLEDVPSIRVGEFKVVEPKTLLSYYGRTHASSHCWAVKAAQILIERGISPINRIELLTNPNTQGIHDRH